MSELKDHWEYENGPIVMRRKVYYKDDVDAVIAEKDRALEYAKALTLKDIETIKEKDKEIAELKKKLMPCINGDCILTCEVVEKYGKENAELKAEIESLKASHYAEMVDAGMRERRLKRALYKACANWMIDRQCAMSCFHLEARAKKFDKAIDKCRAKVEEYK